MPTELRAEDRLLDATERIYRTSTAHPYDRALSRDVIAVLAQTADEPAFYTEELEAFAERYRRRLERNLADYGPTTRHYEDERYVLASQPEGLIVFERLSKARFRLQSCWYNSELPERLLDDAAQIWGVGL